MHKNKMLLLIEILNHETDPEHPITTNALIEKLSKHNVPCERRTLARDISQLIEMNYPIKCVRIGHSNAFYMEHKNFSISELKIIIDAIQASAVIPDETANSLTEKIALLGGPYCAELLHNNRIRFNIRKQTNNSIWETITLIEESFINQTQVSFLYFKHDENGKRVYQRNKQRYVVDPIALIYENDNYYLRCYNQERKDYRNYRIDRMENTQRLDTIICDEALISPAELETYTAKTFKMLGGDETDVEFEFTEELIDVIFDQFGFETIIHRKENGLYSAKVRVQISRTFWGWYFQFPDQIRIISPKSAAEKCKEWAKHVLYGETKDK